MSTKPTALDRLTHHEECDSWGPGSRPCSCAVASARAELAELRAAAKLGALVTSLYRKVYDEPAQCGWPPKAFVFVKFEPHMPACRVTVSRPYTKET